MISCLLSCHWHQGCRLEYTLVQPVKMLGFNHYSLKDGWWFMVARFERSLEFIVFRMKRTVELHGVQGARVICSSILLRISHAFCVF